MHGTPRTNGAETACAWNGAAWCAEIPCVTWITHESWCIYATDTRYGDGAEQIEKYDSADKAVVRQGTCHTYV